MVGLFLARETEEGFGACLCIPPLRFFDMARRVSKVSEIHECVDFCHDFRSGKALQMSCSVKVGLSKTGLKIQLVKKNI